MDDDEARELMERVVAEKQEDAEVRRWMRAPEGEPGPFDDDVLSESLTANSHHVGCDCKACWPDEWRRRMTALGHDPQTLDAAEWAAENIMATADDEPQEI